MLGHATVTPAAMLTPERRADHACHAEVGLVKFPQLDKLINDGLLLCNAAQLGHKAWIVNHADDVEVARKPIENDEGDIEKIVRVQSV
jgi:hypothetical protein